MNQGPEKILYLITKGFWGGAQRYVFDLATNLPKDRFEAVVAYGQYGALADELKTAGIRTIRIPSLGRDVAFASDVKSFFEIWRMLRVERPGVLHLNSSKAAAFGALAGRLAGVKKIIFTVHGWPFGEKRNALSRALIWLISWFTALLSTNVICISNVDLETAKKMPRIGKKSVRIYNGIDLKKQYASGETVRKEFPGGAHITGIVAELTKNKNIGSLIEEAKSDKSMHVAIVGEGEERATLEARIKAYDLGDRVKLFGFVPIEQVVRGFDVFALPSLKEGLPYVLLEARAAGVPIKANRVGGVGEILDAKSVSEFSLEHMLERTIALY